MKILSKMGSTPMVNITERRPLTETMAESYAMVRRSLLFISPMHTTTSEFISAITTPDIESLLLWLAPLTIKADAVPPIMAI